MTTDTTKFYEVMRVEQTILFDEKTRPKRGFYVYINLLPWKEEFRLELTSINKLEVATAAMIVWDQRAELDGLGTDE